MATAPTTSHQADSEVSLVLPALPEFGRIARIAMSGVALRNGFSYPAVEDLRLAMDESLILLLGSLAREGRIVVDFGLRNGAMRISVRADFDDDTRSWDEDGAHRFEMLVSDLVDSYELDRLHLTVSMSRAATA